MRYKILKEEFKYDGFLKIKKAEIEYDSFKSNLPIIASRECLERGDSVAVLIYEKDTDSFIFTNQFRYPTIKNDSGWIIPITY